ncbi:MAG: cob(I)yrinic acid a,c-diamide adenosyltransferase [Lachnospiraceae bacterium]|jgi:cob(I)alamin adenosyltransferase|nr:cob(I)yrinic acid a,c-diamide adenosyltransferase [Lachnospiraceae bacterium]
MREQKVTVYCGEGKGKTAAALGYAIQAASHGESVIIIQFLKGKKSGEMEFLRRMEPEIKVFSFTRLGKNFAELSEEERQEEGMNIRNGFNFAKKVLVTGECSLLVLDDFLSLLNNGLVTQEDLEALMKAKSEDTELILTGRGMNAALKGYAGKIYEIREESQI